MRTAGLVGLFVVVSIFVALVGVLGLEPDDARATMPSGEYWRLPWKADSTRNVSGYGYGEGTHDDLDHWALDFQASEGTYITATQEGRVFQTFADVNCEDGGDSYGSFVQIDDTGEFRHLYAHLSVVYVSTNQWVLPGLPLITRP
jgi:murein DD-endopeptidase MepM/ murein hydrolase activator NlpD